MFLVNRPAPAPSRVTSKPSGRPSQPEVPASQGSRVTNPDAYFSGFKQGGTGNCVSVAAIKAAMTRFGPDQVFKSVTRSGNGYDVTMRDGVKVRVSDAELSTASRLSRFSGKDPSLLRQANLMYAAMANRAQLEGNDGRKNMSFERACQSLNDGESYLEGARWLGLKNHMRKINPRDLDNYKAVVAASSKHAVYASNGYVDHYGRKKDGTRNGDAFEGWGRTLRGAYALI
ncbi:hypothetical protein [Hyalangium minutum]|uniref:Uncharacterized protein n=1 Tax=Hyalangium minutum TaxID=394096 RepID=A0A085WKK1_9BACT|nr:hypothetical protein [Hyalangium minutum]KFE68214.1 hypothetical protein DB31_7451 [Hyalangium minutum]